ncbi:MAG: lipoyl(octanoyl) transferase LipB [Candidatus Competibacterales bacterium]
MPPWSSGVVQARGTVAYAEALVAMVAATASRDAHTPDALWLLEHEPVYTLGANGRREHLHNPGSIPVVASDRGGQVTYHGPGQIVLYCLLDLRRRGMGARALVTALEQAVIALLARWGVKGIARPEAPGVYVEGRKLASVGLRVRRGCSYHGVSLNVAMDLAPFGAIDPCGYPGLTMTQLVDLGISLSPSQAGADLAAHLIEQLPVPTPSFEGGSSLPPGTVPTLR